MMTGVGVLLGTAAYMSPEQAKGREADKRSDIWAFGCVLYEMLTGRRAFDGEDMTEVLGAVVRLEPSWEALPSNVPQPIRTLLHQCLVKDRRKRIADIAAARFVLEHQADVWATSTASAAPLARRPLWRRVAALTAGALVIAAVATTLTWFATHPASPRVERFTIAPAGTSTLRINGTDRDLAITPDGTRVIYVGNSGTQLFVRPLDQLEPKRSPLAARCAESSSRPMASGSVSWMPAQSSRKSRSPAGPP
jgi:serine/threonine-protein kinase